MDLLFRQWLPHLTRPALTDVHHLGLCALRVQLRDDALGLPRLQVQPALVGRQLLQAERVSKRLVPGLHGGGGGGRVAWYRELKGRHWGWRE